MSKLIGTGSGRAPGKSFRQLKEIMSGSLLPAIFARQLRLLRHQTKPRVVVHTFSIKNILGLSAKFAGVGVISQSPSFLFHKTNKFVLSPNSLFEIGQHVRNWVEDEILVALCGVGIDVLIPGHGIDDNSSCPSAELQMLSIQTYRNCLEGRQMSPSARSAESRFRVE